jgi:hypothetical protein
VRHAEEIVFLTDEQEENFQQKIILVTEKWWVVRNLCYQSHAPQTQKLFQKKDKAKLQTDRPGRDFFGLAKLTGL